MITNNDNKPPSRIKFSKHLSGQETTLSFGVALHLLQPRALLVSYVVTYSYVTKVSH